ncbi:MAG: cupin domain-containing protein [Gammaproteobacteria bacterium]|nr:cupin domain-containing protein [Gammaproteobacteria bacterium]
MASEQKFLHHEAATGKFVTSGLRSYFEYRDLGIKDATRGDFVAHVIRAREGCNATGNWHMHDCTFQMVYVLKGWARFEYDGQGEHIIREGDCVLQPAGIRHRELEHSEDFEVLEIVAPGDFDTHALETEEQAAEGAK